MRQLLRSIEKSRKRRQEYVDAVARLVVQDIGDELKKKLVPMLESLGAALETTNIVGARDSYREIRMLFKNVLDTEVKPL